MPIKAEILTDLGAKHVITLHDDMGFLNLADAYDFVRKVLMDDGVFSNDVTEEFLEINCLEKYQYIKLWRETTFKELVQNWGKPQPEIQEQKDLGVPTNWAGFAHYLGQKITVEGLRLEYGGLSYLMPLKIDGKHPYDALRTDNLNTFMLGLKTKYEIDVIVSIPSITFSEAEAVHFLVDYAVAHNPDPVRNVGETTGRAAGVLWEE